DRFVGIGRASRQVPAIVAHQQRERVAIDPDHAAPGIARQAQQRAGTVGTMMRCMLHKQPALAVTVILRGFQLTEPLSCRYLRHSCKISHAENGAAAKVLWTGPVSTVTVLISWS